jgi:predicted NBD/HSP70 family sugar kinase
MTGGTAMVRELNTGLVRNTLRGERRATKHRIAEITGLSVVTVASVLRTLTERREAFAEALVPSRGGRPAREYRYNAGYACGAVIFGHEYQGKDTFFVRVVNLFGEILYAAKTKTPEIRLRSFEKILDGLIKSYPAVKMIGFGLPGREYNGVMTLNDYPYIEGSRFSDHYRNRYGLPVVFENDVNSAVLGYCGRHELSGDSGIVYIYFPRNYPPGAGILINGKLIRGWKNYAGELKWLPLGARPKIPRYDGGRIVSRIIQSVSAVLNPEKIILAGDLFNPPRKEARWIDPIRRIKKDCASVLGASCPDILVSGEFTLDFERGIIGQTLSLFP